jgi:hypothetical protein
MRDIAKIGIAMSVINGNVARLLFVGASFAHAVRTMAINLSLKLAALTAGGCARARGNVHEIT